MHEMSIVQALLEQVEAEVDKAGQGGRVSSLELIVGKLSGVHADSIRFAFELLSPGTLAEGAALHISEPPAHVRCLDCQAQSPVDELVMHCPRCGSGHVSIEGGRELLLQSIDVDT